MQIVTCCITQLSSETSIEIHEPGKLKLCGLGSQTISHWLLSQIPNLCWNFKLSPYSLWSDHQAMALGSLSTCAAGIENWFSVNRGKLNFGKNLLLYTIPPGKASAIVLSPLVFGDSAVLPPSDQPRNLGITFYSDLTKKKLPFSLMFKKTTIHFRFFPPFPSFSFVHSSRGNDLIDSPAKILVFWL